MADAKTANSKRVRPGNHIAMRRSRAGLVLLFAALVLVPGSSDAFERDVHFGLTRWLALKAGFTAQQADALAIGDQRVDSGDMQFIELASAYACFAKNPESAALVRQHHYPSSNRTPSPPDQRAVASGSDAARRSALDAANVSPQQAGFLLFKFAEALHAVQDSWSHQGIPDVPRPLQDALACDPNLAWAHPRARGGWNSHNADHTHRWPADTIAMARATYELLLHYPAIGGVQRSAKGWAEIQPALDAFVRASTKSEKKKWFVGQGFSDVSFLEGISLADGAEAFTLRWDAHKLPSLPALQSTQHHIDAGLLDFYNRFFAQWASTDDFDALAAAFGVPGSPARGNANGTRAAMDKGELSARLLAWRMRDHGRVADVAHASKPLTAKERSTLLSMAKDRTALARYALPTEAFLPLEVKGPAASPLLGFVVAMIGASPAANERAIATARFRHAPYDTILVLAERLAGSWRVIAVDAIVDH
jgi:hypothetical protein